jgi:hypothetical protein
MSPCRHSSYAAYFAKATKAKKASSYAKASADKTADKTANKMADKTADKTADSRDDHGGIVPTGTPPDECFPISLG